MDARDGGQAAGPAAATPAAALFNIPGLNLSSGLIYEGGNGGEGATRITLINLNPGLLYDLAFYGNRTVAEGLTEQFTLGGAEASFNLSSSGNIDAVTTRLDTRLNTDDVIRWTGINPGADGIITVTMDPEWDGELANVAYLGAMRLEELGSNTPLQITRIDYSPDEESVSLTWTATDDSSYGAFFSTDLTEWTRTIPESLGAADDENLDDGDQITVTFNLAEALLETKESLFFRIVKE